MRRIVVTGLGMTSPLGVGVQNTWNRLVAGESGIRRISGFEIEDLAAQVAGQVPRSSEPEAYKQGLFNPDDFMSPKDQRKVGDYIIHGLGAADEAIRDSGWEPKSEEDRYRIGVMIGCGIGGLEGIYDTSVTLLEKGPKRVSPFFIPSCLINLVSGYVSIKHGIKGPNHSVVTACSTGAHAIGDAARIIQYGDADIMLAGGSEAAVCRLGIAGFAAARALATKYNDTPAEASRPWDKGRDGFVMGEGSGVLVLEELEHAKRRGAKIYAEVIGYGMSGDAYHVTAPAEDGNGAYRAMEMALKRAQLSPDQIGYINAHGTATMGDMIELNAVRRLFGSAIETVSMSSTKSSIGHLLGAAGSVEAIFSILALKNSLLPPTLNLVDPDDGTEGVDLIPLKAKEKVCEYALSNSFGFGGTNASLIFKKWS